MSPVKLGAYSTTVMSETLFNNLAKHDMLKVGIGAVVIACPDDADMINRVKEIVAGSMDFMKDITP